MPTRPDEVDLPPRAPRAWRFIPEEPPPRTRWFERFGKGEEAEVSEGDGSRRREPGHGSGGQRRPPSKVGTWLGAPWRRLHANMVGEGTRWSTAAALVAVVVSVGVLGFWAHLVSTLPSMDELREARFAQASVLYTRFVDNERPDEIEVTRYPSENREWVVLDSISPHVVHALIDTEDRRFREHNGVDVKRLVSSTLQTLAGDTQGGSTITMQFTRNRFSDLTEDDALTRKFKEWVLSYVMEGLHSKDAILEMYLNEVPFLYNAYGVQQAARTYFNKNAAALDADEAATLVGMLKATSLYNPVPRDSLPDDLYDIRRPMRLQQVARSMERRNVVMGLMNAAGDLSDDSLAQLSARPTALHFKMQAREDRIAPYFVDAARHEFEAWARVKGIENLNTAGYRVYTTLDPVMQAAAEEALRRQSDRLQIEADRQFGGNYSVVDTTGTVPVQVTGSVMRRYLTNVARQRDIDADALMGQFVRQSSEYFDLMRTGVPADSAFAQLKGNEAFVDTLLNRMRRVEAGFVAMEPVSRKVRAYVGGRGFGDKQFDHVGVARRQPGSTFKPFVYAAALASNKFTPDSRIRDAYSCREPDGKTWWRPTSSGSNGGTFAVRDALKHSKNAASVNLMMSIGRRSRECSDGLGPKMAANVARAAGLTIPQSCEVPSLALGICEQTLLQMANGYSTLADYGIYRKPRFIERIVDRDGNLVADFNQVMDNPAVDAIDPIVSFTVVDMMRGVISGGTGVRLNGYGLGRIDVAGKTGTTQHGSDGWFMAVTRDLVMGAWVGFDSPVIAWKSLDLQQGSRTALPIVGEFIKRVRQAEPTTFQEQNRFEKPRPRPKVRLMLTPAQRAAQQRDSLRRDSVRRLENRRRDSLRALEAARAAAIEAAKTPEQRAAEAAERERRRQEREARREAERNVPTDTPPAPAEAPTPQVPLPTGPPPETVKKENEEAPVQTAPKEKTTTPPPGGNLPGGTRPAPAPVGGTPPGGNRPAPAPTGGNR